MVFGFDVAHRRPELLRVVAALLEALTVIDAMQVRDLPPIYASGVRYTREPKRRERWQDARTSARLLEADCEDLAAWRAAELRASGVWAIALPVWASSREIHCVVATSRGVEDPSKRLGLRYPAGTNLNRPIQDALSELFP